MVLPCSSTVDACSRFRDVDLTLQLNRDRQIAQKVIALGKKKLIFDLFLKPFDFYQDLDNPI